MENSVPPSSSDVIDSRIENDGHTLKKDDLLIDEKPDLKHKNKKHKKSNNNFRWPIIVLILTLVLSLTFSFGSELILSGTGVVVSIILLILFISLAVICDMIGVAATAADISPFVAMSSRKVKASRQALLLVKNAEKLSSICCDIIGDMCGILSGAVGASIVASVVIHGEIQQVLFASFISAIIASVTVFLKAICKRIAIKNANTIIFVLAKVISFFKFKKN